MSVTWVEANLGALLPPGTLDLIDTVKSTVDLLTPMLDTVAGALDAASTFIAGWPVFDFAKLLGDLIAAWKNDFLMTGLYMLPLWDYPIKQLTASKDYGPSRVLGVLNFQGTTFQDLSDDISRSLLSQKDPLRPRFNFDCAMLVLIAAYPSIAAVPLTMEDGGLRLSFPGLKDLQGAAKGIQELRWKGAWGKMRAAVDTAPPDLIEARTNDVVEALELYSVFDQDEQLCIPVPGEDLGDPYFEKTAAQDIPYTAIQTVVDNVQFAYEPREYPCWARVNMVDLVPPLQAIADQIFDPIIALLQSSKNIQQVILDLIEAIKKRVEALQDIVAQIDYLLDQLEALLNTTGFYAVFINSAEGTTGLIDQLRSSDSPFVDEEGRPTYQFFTGMVLVAGGPPLAAFRLLMAPVAGV